MNPQNQPDRDQELKQREQALRQRELEIRLRELDAEINTKLDKNDQPPTHQTVKHREPTAKNWLTRTSLAAKFFGIVVAVIVAVKIASWVTTVLLFGAIAWLGYQIFKSNSRKS